MASGNLISICNRSLLAISARAQISSLTEGSAESNACSVLFTPTFEQLARAAYWNCLRNQATLTLLQAAAGTPENPQGTTLPLPPTPWLYAYQVPSDCLQSRYIVPSLPATGNNPISPAMTPAATWLPQQQIPFHVVYGTDTNGAPLQLILTNQRQAQLVYTINQPNPQTWDSEFQAAMVASLGAYLVPAISGSMAMMQMQIALAEKIIATARVRDANEGSTIQDHIPDFIRARNGGNGYYNGYGAYGGYYDMVW